MIVRADRDALCDAADQMLLIDKDLKRIQYAIEQIVYSTCTDWQGDAERAFAEKIILINEKFDILHSFVTDYSQKLKVFADAYEEFDTDIAKKINLI